VWAAGALGLDPAGSSVIWTDQNVERPELPYLGLQVTSGPTRRGQDASLWPRLMPSVVDVQVLPSAVAATGDALRFFVNGELFEHLAGVGETVEDARDAALEAIEASVQLGATVAAVSTDKLRLTAARPGSLAVETAIGCSATTITSQLVKLTRGARLIRVRATAYGIPEPRAPGDVGVAEWIELLAEASDDEDLRLALRRQGYVVAQSTVLQQRASAPSGAEREPRAAADIIFACNVTRGRLVSNYVEHVDVDVPVVS
jgi:hypothetical protein